MKFSIDRIQEPTYHLRMAVSTQPIKILDRALREIRDPETYLFSASDLAALVPHISHEALNLVLARAVKNGILERACRGIYIRSEANYRRGLELFHIAAKIRYGCFNYISQETVLSDLGIISQLPFSRIAIMSSGSSGIVDCGRWGDINFTHTKKLASSLSEMLFYDERCRMLRANARLAYGDLRAARRNLHMIDEDALNEYLV